MVAYSFKEQFVEPIISGRKTGTVRGKRKRHAMPGEQVQLYKAMRTKHCRLIGLARCTDAVPIRLELRPVASSDCLYIACGLATEKEREAFAIGDGFDGWPSLRAFWRDNHPGVDDFDGVWIRWTELEGGMFADRYYR